jgi:outer membrane lipoprotein-sorting protein
VLEKELRDTISTALDALPEKLRLTTLLYYTDGLSYQEIASFQEVPVTTVKSRLYESRKRLKAMLSKEVIPMMKDVLKSQAPKEDFSDKIMEILANMEASAKAIRSVQFTVEDHFGGWVYYTQVAYFSPNLWRVESDNALFVCNGEKIWRYDKTWKLVDVSTVDEPDRPIIPQWWHSGIGFRMSLEKKDATFLGMGQYIPQWHFLFTRDKVDADFELKLEESQEMYLLRMTKPKRDVRDRVYFYPRQLTETPKRKLFSEEIFYSLFYGSSGLSVEMKILDMSSDW